MTPVQFDVPLDFIIISYFPGSFGSFLYQCINSADELNGRKERDFFVPCGGAHKVLDDIFDRVKKNPIGVFHDGEEVEPWLNMSNSDKCQYLRDNLNYEKVTLLQNLNPNRKYFLHRWVYPKYEHLVKKYLNCKMVGVIIEDEFDRNLTTKMHVDKSLIINQTWNILPKLQKHNPILGKIFPKLTEQQQREKLTEISQKHFVKIDGPRMYDIGIRVKEFMDYDLYLPKLKEIANFLDIHLDYDYIDEIYKDFHRINQFDRINEYDHSI